MYRAAHDLADGDFLSPVFRFKEREAEYTDKRDEDANEGKEAHLGNKPEFFFVGNLQILVQEAELTGFFRVQFFDQLFQLFLGF